MFAQIIFRFSEILLNSKKLQSKLILNIHSKQYYHDMINHSKKLPYKNINIMKHQDDDIYNDTLRCDVIYDILVNLQKHVEKIQVFNVDEFWPLETFSICENLAELRLIEDDESILYESANVVFFPVLKILEIKCSRDCEILDSLIAPKLEKFVLRQSFKNLKAFLTKSENLKILKIHDACVDDFQGLDTVKLNLRTLSLGLGSFRVELSFAELQEDRTWTRTLEDFLRTQLQSLEDVTLDFMIFEDNSYKIVKICLSELKLSKLSLKIEENYTKFKKLSVNNSIKILKFQGYMNNENLKHLISCCPQVTDFTLNCTSTIGSNIIKHIATSMPNMKYFEIDSLILQIVDQIIFKNVEKLKIRLLNQELWHKIAMICPNLKELELIDKTVAVLPINIGKVLLLGRHLRTITFNADMNLICKDGFFDVFMKNYVKIKRINFYAVNFENLFFNRVGLLTGQRPHIQVCCRNNLF